MSDNAFINILIAEDNDVSREMMSGVMRTQGFKVFGAIDGESAIKVVSERPIDLALVDINMTPKGGFDFVRHLVARGIKLPVVIVTGDDSADLLVEASALGVDKILQKPVSPERLIQTVERILKRQGVNPAPLAVEGHDARHGPEDLMNQTLSLAAENANNKKGGPYAAIVATQDGKILGIGMNGHSARVDPTAHAEVMAIRQAAEKLGKSDLSECLLYCSSQPTRIGEALISSVGIAKVYYGLSHEDTGQIEERKTAHEPEYHQLARDKALEMFKASKS